MLISVAQLEQNLTTRKNGCQGEITAKGLLAGEVTG